MPENFHQNFPKMILGKNKDLSITIEGRLILIPKSSMHTNIELHSKVESDILKVVPIQNRGNPIKYTFEYIFTINNMLVHSLALAHLLFLLHVGVKQPNMKSGLSSNKRHYELKLGWPKYIHYSI